MTSRSLQSYSPTSLAVLNAMMNQCKTARQGTSKTKKTKKEKKDHSTDKNEKKEKGEEKEKKEKKGKAEDKEKKEKKEKDDDKDKKDKKDKSEKEARALPHPECIVVATTAGDSHMALDLEFLQKKFDRTSSENEALRSQVQQLEETIRRMASQIDDQDHRLRHAEVDLRMLGGTMR